MLDGIAGFDVLVAKVDRRCSPQVVRYRPQRPPQKRHTARMPYRRSVPLERWLTERHDNCRVLERAHATVGYVTGPGRPLELGRPVAHAYILRLVAEFQGFVRDLHGLAVDRFVELSNPDPAFVPLLVEGLTRGRAIDKANADMSTIKDDFRRLGLSGLSGRLAKRSNRWSKNRTYRGDQGFYQDLIELRNALAHGDERRRAALRARDVRDTVSWARARLPALDRMARGLDRVVWDHLEQTFGAEPW